MDASVDYDRQTTPATIADIPESVRERGVWRAVAELDGSIEALDAEICQLMQRLETVTQPAVPSESPGDLALVAADCELSQRLSLMNRKVASLADCVTGLRYRIDL